MTTHPSAWPDARRKAPTVRALAICAFGMGLTGLLLLLLRVTPRTDAAPTT